MYKKLAKRDVFIFMAKIHGVLISVAFDGHGKTKNGITGIFFIKTRKTWTGLKTRKK